MNRHLRSVCWCAGVAVIGLLAVLPAAADTGAIAEYAIPTAGSQPVSIVGGRDGALWFTEIAGNKIGRATTDGAMSEFAIPTSNSRPDEIAVGPDGNLWFAEVFGDKIVASRPAAY